MLLGNKIRSLRDEQGILQRHIIAKTKCAKIENETSKTYLFFASQFSATLSNV